MGAGVVYDKGTGEEIPITSRNLESVREALRGGQYLVKDAVSVVDKNGKLYSVDPSSGSHQEFLQGVLSGTNGEFRLATVPEIENVEEQKEFAGREVAAGFYGLAEGVFPIVATPALKALGIEARTLRGLKEHNEGAFDTGQLTGVIGTGAAALAARGAVQGASLLAKAGAATPAGQITKLGLATEALARRVLPGAAAENFLARATHEAGALAAAGSVEGALFGVGEAVRENALGNPEFAAESLIGYTGLLLEHAGTGAAFGAAGGAVIGGGVSILSRAASKLTKGGLVSKEAREGAKLLSRNGMEQELTDEAAEIAAKATLVDRGKEGLADVAERMAREVGGEDAGQVARRLVTDEKFARIAVDADNVIRAELPALKQDLDMFEKLSHRARKFGGLEMKEELFRKHVTGPLTPEAVARSAALMDETWALAAKMENASGDFLAGSGYAKKLREVAKSLEARVDEAPKFGKESLGREVPNFDEMMVGHDFSVEGAIKHMTWMNRTKQMIGQLADGTRNPNVQEALEDLFGKYRLHLEDESLFGGMATAQRGANEHWPDFLATNKAYGGKFLKDSAERLPEGEFGNFFEVDPEALTHWAKDAGTFENSRIDRIMDQRLDRFGKLYGRFGELYDIPPDLRGLVFKEMPDAAKRIRERLDRIRTTVGAKNSLENLRKATQASTLGRMAAAGGAAVGMAVGGFPGGLTGAVAGNAMGNMVRSLLLDPAALAKFAHSGSFFPRALLTAAGAMASTLRGVSRATTGMLRATGEARALPVLIAVTAEELPKRYRRAVADVLTATNDPGTLADGAVMEASGLEVETPNVAMMVKAKVEQRAQFLKERIPPVSLPEPGREDAGKEKIGPASTQAMRRYLRFVEATRKPHAVLEHLASSGTASAEELEAMKVLSPQLFALVRANTAAEISSRRGKKALSATRRRRIGTMLDMKLDDLNSPGLYTVTQSVTVEGGDGSQTEETLISSGRPQTFSRSRTDTPDSERATRLE